MTDAFTYAELDEILRGTGHSGAIGMSAIDGLIAALVAAPSFVHPEEWIPLVFGGRQPPLHENTPELHALRRVAEILADAGDACQKRNKRGARLHRAIGFDPVCRISVVAGGVLAAADALLFVKQRFASD